MNQSVACDDIRERDVGIVDHYGITDREGELLTVGSVCEHTIRDVLCRNLCRYDVVKENIAQLLLSCRCVKRCKIDSCIGEGLIGWCKDSEWTWSLECRQKVSLDDCGDKRVVNSSCLSRCWNIDRRHQNLVDNVNDSI